MRGYRNSAQTVVFFIALALLWEYGVRWFGVKRYLLPPLSDVLVTTWTIRDTLLAHTLVTLWEVAAGFAFAVAGGLVIGILVFFSPFAQRTVYPLVALMQGLPKIALAPLLVVWFGYGDTSKVLMSFLFAFFPIVISTVGGLATTPANLIEHFNAIGAPRRTTFWRLRVPSALPNFIDGCKMAMPLAVIGAIVGEFVGSEEGLGNLILAANASARTDILFAALIAVTLVSAALYWAIQAAGNRVWWRSL